MSDIVSVQSTGCPTKCQYRLQGVSLGPELPEQAGGLLGGYLAVVLHSHRDLLKLN